MTLADWIGERDIYCHMCFRLNVTVSERHTVVEFDSEIRYRNENRKPQHQKQHAAMGQHGTYTCTHTL